MRVHRMTVTAALGAAARARNADAGTRVIRPDHALDVEEVQALASMVAAINPRLALEYRREYGTGDVGVIRLRRLESDPNPPPLLEGCPLPLVRG